MLTGRYRSRQHFTPEDFRQILPHFTAESLATSLPIVDGFTSVATKHKTTTSQVALAWIRARYPDSPIVPIPGAKHAKWVEENAGGAHIQLDEEDIKTLGEAMNGVDVVGDQFHATWAWLANKDCIPLSEWKGEYVSLNQLD